MATVTARVRATAPVVPRPRAGWGRPRAALLAALVGSRLVVLAAGIAGALALHSHAIAVQVAQTRGLGAVGRLLAASADRFDAGYYLAIAAHGYGGPGSLRIAFFPAYPEAVRALGWLVVSPALAGVLVSLVAFGVALGLLHRLTELELGRPAADATVLLLGFAPLSFFFSAIYSESLFLALAVGSVLAARTGRWRLACGLGAAATLARPTGILLAGALAVTAWRDGGPRRTLGWLALLPGVLAAWMLTLDLLGHGLTGELSIEHEGWHRVTMFPLEGLVVGLAAGGHGALSLARGATFYRPTLAGPFGVAAQDVMLGGVLVICLVAWEACRRRMRPEYPVLAGLVLLMCLGTPEQGEPLWSFDRFALTIFPLWMVAGWWLARHRRLLAAVLAVSAAWLVFDTMQVASWSFIA
jgi:hypothetical protein